MKMYSNFFSSFFMVLFLFGLSHTVTAQSKNFNPATNYEEYQKLFKNMNVSIARTKAQFVAMVKEDASLSKVFDEKTLKTFTEGLKMSKEGLVTFSYQPLMSKNPENYTEHLNAVLQIFGFAPIDVLGADYEGFRCESPATCVASIGSICIGENCK